MGNQLTGLSPSPVVNIEEYLSELSGLVIFEEELCGSRLFKVAKIRSIDGDNPRSLVVKIFPNPNVSQLLWRYQAVMSPYCHRINSGYNLLFFNTSYITERCGVLIRDFIDQSLADRLCTRPFLCIEDKRWIAYQLLCAVDQLHSSSTTVYSKNSRTNYPCLCHGDIKAENVLITSWGWVLLADPAPFKPVWLPSDNPSEFTHFFDSSRRRVCYLAPERFVEVHHCTSAATATTTATITTGFEAMNLDNPLEEVTICSEETKNNLNVLIDESDDPVVKSITEEESNALNKEECIIESSKQELTVEVSNLNGRNQNNQNFPKSESSYLVENPSEILTQLSVTSSPSIILNTEDCDIQNSNDDEVDLKQSTRFMPSNSVDLDCQLTPSMDLFSIGCVLLELFTDGSIAFTLADLLGYRRNDQSRLLKLLDQIPCEHAKSLISSLLSLNKEERLTAADHLEQQRGRTFPSVFYTHLTPYLQNFLNPILNCPDSRIAFLRLTITNFLRQVTDTGSENLSTVAVILHNLIISVLRPTSHSQNTQTPITAADLPTITQISKINYDPFNLIRNTLHSSNKKAYSSQSNFLSETGKINALICLLEIAAHMQPNLLMDRVIPYCIELTTLAHSGEVRSLAVESLTHIFKLVIQKCERITEFASFLEETFLTEYLFPNLAPLSSDPKPEVRLTLARCLPTLATYSLTFLNIISKLRLESTDVKLRSAEFVHDYHQSDRKPSDNYLPILRSHIQERLVALFSDSDPHVRLGLMNTNGLSCLASFFGRSGTNGTLLSHMITFLNDKSTPELRAAFFRQVSPLATLTGAQFVTILRSLLEQGLIDPDDMVIEECLLCLINLLRRRLLSAPIAVSFLTRALALTAHPCLRIRQASIAYITTFARLAANFAEKSQSRILTENEDSIPMVHHFWPGICSPASIYARLVNSEVKKTIFRRPVNFCFTNDAVLLSSLHPPINRTILEALTFMPHLFNSSMNQLLSSSDSQSRLDRLNQLLKLFQERKSSRAVTRSGETPCYTSPNDEFTDALILKLKSLGLTELMESQLVNLSTYIVNLCQNGRPQSHFNSSNPKVNRIIPRYNVYSIEKWDKMVLRPKPISPCNNPKDFLEDPSHLQWLLSSPLQRYANLLWERLRSGRLTFRRDSFDSGKTFIFGRSLIFSPSSVSHISGGDNVHTSTSNTNLTKMGTIGTLVHGEMLSSSPSFTEIINPLFGIRSTPKNMFEIQGEIPIWPESRPQGIMLANLREHRAGMISLATHSSGRLFASCSSGDGSVKLWNCGFWPTESDGYVEQSTTGSHSGRLNSALSEPVQKSSNLKNPELGLAYCLPTRSSWTFICSGQDSFDSSTTTCRGLVWTSNGACLVTILDGKWLQQIDVATGLSSGTSQLNIDNAGRAVCLKTSACCHFPTQYNLVQQVMVTGSDANSIAYATTSNQIVARDLRVPSSSSPVWILKQDRTHGLILSMEMHSFHTWLVTGTSRGHIVCWDLRYKRQIAYTEHPYQPGIGILDLKIAEIPSQSEIDVKSAGQNRHQSSEKPCQIGQTLIIAATDHHNEVTIWDLESSATASSSAAISSCNYGLSSSFASVRSTGCLASTWAQPGNKAPLILDSSVPHRSVRSILCLPNNKSVMPFNDNKLNARVINHLPALVAGGNDARLRYWNFRKPEDSCVLVWAGNDEEVMPPRLTYRSMDVNDVYVLIEQSDTPSFSGDTSSSLLTKTINTETQKLQPPNNTTETSNSAFPTTGRLELRESTKGHKNIISDLTILQAGQAFLVSSSMDGVIKIWR